MVFADEAHALLSGILAGSAMHAGQSLLKVADVAPHYDTEGNYKPYFTVTLESGQRYRVTVEPLGGPDGQ